MFDLGDEFIIEGYRIPWLIWIQILVMILLIILLCYFSIFGSDLSDHATAAAPPSSGSLLRSNIQSHLNNPQLNTGSCLHKTKVGENQSIQGETGTSTSRGILRGEDIQEREVSTTKDTTYDRPFGISYHPCHYFGLAKQAFLKCLGLDSTSESSSNIKHRKEH